MTLYILLFLSLFFIFFIYGGYKIILGVLSKIKFKHKYYISDDIKDLPSISIYLCCFNEEDIIQKRLQNIINTTFPLGKMEIIIYSDGSTDNTIGVVKKFSQSNKNIPIQIIEEHQNYGQAHGQMLAALRAKNEVLVKTDAETTFTPETLIELVKPFTDPKIGVVGGVIEYVSDSNIGEDYKKYRSTENDIRRYETFLGLGCKVDGPCMSYRKSIAPQKLHSFEDVDHVMPIIARQEGLLTFNAEKSLAFDIANSNIKQELKQRSRMTRKTVLSTFYRLGWKTIFKSFSFTICLISHRIIRLLSPFFFILFLLSLVILNKKLLIIIITITLIFALINKKVAASIKSLIIANAGFFIGWLSLLKKNQKGFYLPTKNYKS